MPLEQGECPACLEDVLVTPYTPLNAKVAYPLALDPEQIECFMLGALGEPVRWMAYRRHQATCAGRVTGEAAAVAPPAEAEAAAQNISLTDAMRLKPTLAADADGIPKDGEAP